jgi:hypothetical protein
VEIGVNLAQPTQFDAGVDLGGRDRGVAEHLLHHSQISASGK